MVKESNIQHTQQIINQQGINTRAEEMWSFITKHVHFGGKTVADFGCGYGDFVWRVANERAFVDAYDKEQKFDIIMPYDIQVVFFKLDLDIINPEVLFWKKYDIALCFSVLPYLKQPELFLQVMAKYCHIGLIECQYEPEPYNIGIENDEQMKMWLLTNGFEFAVPLGKTYIINRDTYRTIWMCT